MHLRMLFFTFSYKYSLLIKLYVVELQSSKEQNEKALCLICRHNSVDWWSSHRHINVICHGIQEERKLWSVTPRNLYENQWTWFMKNWCFEVQFWARNLHATFTSIILDSLNLLCGMTCIAMKLLKYTFIFLCFFFSSFFDKLVIH